MEEPPAKRRKTCVEFGGMPNRRKRIEEYYDTLVTCVEWMITAFHEKNSLKLILSHTSHPNLLLPSWVDVASIAVFHVELTDYLKYTGLTFASEVTARRNCDTISPEGKWKGQLGLSLTLSSRDISDYFAHCKPICDHPVNGVELLRQLYQSPLPIDLAFIVHDYVVDPQLFPVVYAV